MTQPSIDFGKFIQSVASRLSRSVLGYSLVVGDSANGSFKSAFGSARFENGSQSMPVTTSTQYDIASSSKFLTAIVAVQLLQGLDYGAKGVNILGEDLYQPMYKALPPGWQVNQEVQQITYRHLLTHTSGLAPEGSIGEPGQDWVSLRDYITNPTLALPNLGTYGYSNVGFALFRLLVPMLVGFPDTELLPDDVRAAILAGVYEENIQRRVFGAVGVTGPTTHPPTNGNYAFGYTYPVTANGFDPETYQFTGQDVPGCGLSLCAGAGCWSVSADQIAPVLESIATNDGRILSPLQWLVMQGKDARPPFDSPERGLGLDTLTDNQSPGNTGFRWVQKNGGWKGFASSIAFFGAAVGDSNFPASSYWASLFINSNVGGPLQLPGWNWCQNCGALFYDALSDGKGGACPANSNGHLSGGAAYLVTEVDQVSEQVGWKQCTKCLALCYEPSPGYASCCALDGRAHNCPGPTYDLVEADRNTLEWQPGWQWCNQCGVLAYPDTAHDTCKKSGKHNFGSSGRYSLEIVIGPDTVLLEAFRAAAL